MEIHALFQAALGLVPPWQVVEIEFDGAKDSPERGRLTLRLDFPRVGREERMMLEEFGKEHEAYMVRTKRLIPGVW